MELLDKLASIHRSAFPSFQALTATKLLNKKLRDFLVKVRRHKSRSLRVHRIIGSLSAQRRGGTPGRRRRLEEDGEKEECSQKHKRLAVCKTDFIAYVECDICSHRCEPFALMNSRITSLHAA